MASPFLTDVAVAGPFGPKEPVKIDPENPSQSKDLTWTWPIVGPIGRIPLPAANNQGEQVVYVAAEVTAPATMRSRLQLGTAASVQAWLNGKPIYQGRPSNGPALPDQAGVDVELQEGVNRVVFQATYPGNKEALYARLIDPQRKLRYPQPKN